MSARDIVRPEIAQLGSYSLEATQAEIMLHRNESPDDLPLELKREIFAAAEPLAWNRYPPYGSPAERAMLAAHWDWPADGILLGNGSNELLNAVLLATVGQERALVLPVPTFPLYALFARAFNAPVIEVPMRADDLQFDVSALKRAIDRPGVAAVVLCVPNNPTGAVLSGEQVAEITRDFRGVVLLDEAYADFGDGQLTDLLRRRPSWVGFRTFSKAYGLAGLRIGCCLAHPEMAAQIAKVILPYNLNVVAAAAVRVVLRKTEWVRERVARIRRDRDQLARDLAALPHVRVFPSAANFLLIRVPAATRIFQALLDRGLLVRNVSSYPLLADCLRISVGAAHENARLLSELAQLLPKESP